MKIKNDTDLRIAIATLEHEKQMQKELLIKDFHETIQYFKPLNMVKLVIRSGLLSIIVSGVVINAGSRLITKVLVGEPTNILKKMLPLAIKLGLAALFI